MREQQEEKEEEEEIAVSSFIAFFQVSSPA
jgi:hypothetical protein